MRLALEQHRSYRYGEKLNPYLIHKMYTNIKEVIPTKCYILYSEYVNLNSLVIIGFNNSSNIKVYYTNRSNHFVECRTTDLVSLHKYDSLNKVYKLIRKERLNYKIDSFGINFGCHTGRLSVSRPNTSISLQRSDILQNSVGIDTETNTTELRERYEAYYTRLLYRKELVQKEYKISCYYSFAYTLSSTHTLKRDSIGNVLSNLDFKEDMKDLKEYYALKEIVDNKALV